MDALKNIIGDLVIVGMIAAFLDMLLPEGKTRQSVKLIFGLYFIAVLLNPILGFFSTENLSDLDFKALAVEEKIENAEINEEDVYRDAEKRIAHEIAAKCTALYEEGTFTPEVVLTEEEMVGVTLKVQGIAKGRERVVAADIKTFVAKDYGVKKSKIEVIFL